MSTDDISITNLSSYRFQPLIISYRLLVTLWHHHYEQFIKHAIWQHSFTNDLTFALFVLLFLALCVLISWCKKAFSHKKSSKVAGNNDEVEKTELKEDPLEEERQGLVREVGNQAVWSLSSCKPGFGVERLRDNIMDTYWQSDGQLPHLVNVQFHRKTNISQIYIYTDYKLDESYTPSRISIRAGSHFNDLQELQIVDLNEPTGWVTIPIKDGAVKCIRTFMLQIAVISNHQNGRDTHMRQIRIHAPVEDRHYPLELFGKFSTVNFQKFATLR